MVSHGDVGDQIYTSSKRNMKLVAHLLRRISTLPTTMHDPSQLELLPKDLQLLLLSFLEIRDLGICSRLNRKFKELCQEDYLWKQKVKEFVDNEVEWNEVDKFEGNWKTKYQLFMGTFGLDRSEDLENPQQRYISYRIPV
jgi:hypothetical protein